MRLHALILAALLAAPAARAGDHDVQLWRLGNPDDVKICLSACDGSDTQIQPGDIAAQLRFARYATAVGLMFAPSLFEPAATTGQSGFELGFSGKVAFPRLSASEWPSAATLGTAAPPKALFLPTVTLRKGFGASFEVGMHASMLAGSQMVGIGGDVRWAPVEGIDYAPDIALRVYGTRIVGTQELDLVTGGADIGISKSWGVGGMVKLQPYFHFGLVMVNVTTGVLDFRPQTEDAKDPTADDGVFRVINFFDNRYQRFVAGFRLVAGVAVLGLEGSYAYGSSPIQSDKLQDGTAAPKQTLRIWSASGRLGLAF